MTRRLKAPQRRARRAARRNREAGEREFNLLALAARNASEPGMPARHWPGNDVGFLTAVLETHQVPSPLIRRLARAAAAEPLTTRLLDRLAAALADQIHLASLDELLRQAVLPLIGPPGAGKTTLAAKLGAQLGDGRTLLVSTDATRAGGIAQIEEYADVLGLPVTIAQDAAALRRAIDAAAGKVVIDTAGVAPGDPSAREALSALVAASGAKPLLVLPADTAAEEAIALVRFFAPLGTETLIPTRLDLVHHLGGMLAAADAARLALPAAGVTPHFAYGLRQLTPEMLAQRLLTGALAEMRAQTAAA